jgi:hypothetical protein
MINIEDSTNGDSYFDFGGYEYLMWFDDSAYIVIDSQSYKNWRCEEFAFPFFEKIKALPFVEKVECNFQLGLRISFKTSAYNFYLQLREEISSWSDQK